MALPRRRRGYAAAVWALWLATCLQLGAGAAFAAWAGAPLLGLALPPSPPALWAAVSALAGGWVAPRLMAALRVVPTSSGVYSRPPSPRARTLPPRRLVRPDLTTPA